MKRICLFFALVTLIAHSENEGVVLGESTDLSSSRMIVWEDSESDKAIVAIPQPRAVNADEVGGFLAGVVESFLKGGIANPTEVGAMELHGCKGLFIRGEDFDSEGGEFLSLVVFTDKSTLLVQARGTPIPSQEELEQIVQVRGESLELADPIIAKISDTLGSNIAEMKKLAAQARGIKLRNKGG